MCHYARKIILNRLPIQTKKLILPFQIIIITRPTGMSIYRIWACRMCIRWYFMFWFYPLSYERTWFLLLLVFYRVKKITILLILWDTQRRRLRFCNTCRVLSNRLSNTWVNKLFSPVNLSCNINFFLSYFYRPHMHRAL